MANNLIINRLLEARIPVKTPEDIEGFSLMWLKRFLSGSSLIVIHPDYYAICVKLMRMRMFQDITLSMLMISQSELDCRTTVPALDVMALISLYPESIESKRNLPGKLVNFIMGLGGQVLLGCHNESELEGAFPYDLDRINGEFEVIKGAKN